MSDEGIGIAGWLLADLVLVLAIVFLAFTPAGAPINGPLIRDLGCVRTEAEGRIDVRCEPDLGGSEVFDYLWEPERALTSSEPDGEYFEASFEGAGAVRLTVSNEAGEHSTAFPVLPPTAEATVAAPLIRDLGCVRTEAEERIDVRCEPELGGGEVSVYLWEPERALASSKPDAAHFEGSFEGAGAVRLTVANEGGEVRTEFAVLPPRSTVAVPSPECSAVQTDFRFAQIVLTGARLGAVSWDEIAAARVRVDVVKSAELAEIGADEWSDSEAEPFLREKLGEGLRIALVETFSHERGGSHVSLSEEANRVFFDGLREDKLEILRDPAPSAELWNWFGDYRAPSSLDSGEVRLNLYFVKPFDDDDCR